MNHKIILTKIFIIFAFLCIILKPAIAFNATITGLRLWALTVLPGLFPALVATSFILKVFPMNNASSYIYIIAAGILCGFPIGAMLCGQIHKQNKDEFISENIMAFCNISSPSFIINYIINESLKNIFPCVIVLMCVYLPVIECIIFLLLKYKNAIFTKHTGSSETVRNTIKDKSDDSDSCKLTVILDNIMTSSVKSMLKLGAYIVAFSCIAAYIYEFPFMSITLKSIVCGITEITNGIYLCSSLNINNTAKIILITAVNAFGGISTLMQTISMINNTGIKIKKYIHNKIIFTAVTVVNTLFIMYIFYK